MTLPWYKDGLRFKCTGCGKCCTGPSGIVHITSDEAVQMAKALNLTLQVFKIRYTRTRNNQLALVEKKNELGGYDCIFLKDKACQIYQARPAQCRSYPFWPENLNTSQSWYLASLTCEGINDNAPFIPLSEITPALD